MIGWPGKWPWKNHSVAVTDFRPTIRLASTSYSTMRSTSRNGQRCGMSFSIWLVVRIVSFLGADSVTWRLLGALCGGSAIAGGDERSAADAIEQIRCHLAVDEHLVGEDRTVQFDVGRDAVHEQLSQRGVAAGDCLGPIRGP